MTLANVRRWIQEVVTGNSPERRLELLRLLSIGPRFTRELLDACDGANIYPALRQMERDGYVTSAEWPATAERGWRPRYRYTITDAGRALLAGSESER